MKELIHLQHAACPIRFARELLHFDPDPIQAQFLSSTSRRGIVCCTRQWGKSTIGAVKALHVAYYNPASLVIVGSPGGRQSGELVAKCADFLPELGIRPRGDGRNKGSILLPNGSRIVPLPDAPRKIRGYSAPLLILIDEAAYIEPPLYYALLPMLATTDGNLWMMSTPNGKQGLFYETWANPDNGFTRISVTARDCPRISQRFLDEQYSSLPAHVFEQEYLCAFNSSADRLFSEDDLLAAIDPSLEPLA